MTTTNRENYQKHYRKTYTGKRIGLTLTPDEYKAISRLAKSQGQKPTSYVKKLVFSQLNQQIVLPKELQEELKTLRFAILNIANNVNQIAHHSNTVRHLTELEENNLLQHLKQLHEAVEAYTQGRLLQTNASE